MTDDSIERRGANKKTTGAKKTWTCFRYYLRKQQLCADVRGTSEKQLNEVRIIHKDHARKDILII